MAVKYEVMTPVYCYCCLGIFTANLFLHFDEKFHYVKKFYDYSALSLRDEPSPIRALKGHTAGFTAILAGATKKKNMLLSKPEISTNKPVHIDSCIEMINLKSIAIF